MASAKTLSEQVFALIEQCESHSDKQSAARERALKNYNGEATDVPLEVGRSSVVSMDVRSTVKKLMPSIMRTILANDKIVEYQPNNPQAEAGAAQATDYVNQVLSPEADVERALHDAIFDAVLLKTGILNWTAYEQTQVVVQSFTGQAEEAMLGLDAEGEIYDESRDDMGRVSFKLRRKTTKVNVKLRAVPRGAFLLMPNAATIEDSPLVGERQRITRSELVSRGYSKDDVWAIAVDTTSPDGDEAARRGEDDGDDDLDVSKAMETVKIYDVYAMLDLDGDGIAEVHHIVMAETGKDTENGEKRIILEQSHATEVPYADVVIEREAHQFDGHSVAEDMIPIQSVKTALLRSTMNNMYDVNDPTPFLQPEAFQDLESFYKRVPGKPHLLNGGHTAAEAVQYQPTPFIGDKTFPMLQYWDSEAKENTGISDASGGVPADALQNVSATASAMINEAGMAQAEMIVRNLARGGIRKAFRGLLRLVIAHADQPRTMRLRGEWVEVDPRQWDAGMDCTVNVGLGAGSRERDMTMLQMVLGAQREVMASLGALNPLVKPDQLYNTLAKMTETAGFASADPYFTKPDPEEVKAASAPKPDPVQMKLQADMQMEQVKAEARKQVEQAQMQADLMVKKAEIEAQAALSQQSLQHSAILAQQKLDHDKSMALMKAQSDMAMHNDKMQLEYDKLSQPTQEPAHVGQ